MTRFTIDHSSNRPDHIFVEVNSRFDVAIIRTEAGIELQVYPRTDGELWDEPFTTFSIIEADILALEGELA